MRSQRNLQSILAGGLLLCGKRSVRHKTSRKLARERIKFWRRWLRIAVTLRTLAILSYTAPAMCGERRPCWTSWLRGKRLEYIVHPDGYPR